MVAPLPPLPRKKSSSGNPSGTRLPKLPGLADTPGLNRDSVPEINSEWGSLEVGGWAEKNDGKNLTVVGRCARCRRVKPANKMKLKARPFGREAKSGGATIATTNPNKKRNRRELTMMKSMLGVVFGHYDSRGGTTFMPIKAQTADEIKRAMYEYDGVFGIHDDIAQYEKAKAEGNPWNWNPAENLPSECDYMYVAQLWYPEDADVEGDLEETGVVLSEPERGGVGGNTDLPEFTTIEDAVRSAAVQLEYVPMPKALLDKRYDDEDEFFEKVKRAAGTAFSKMAEEIPRWDDDAFGFMVGIGM